MKNKSTIERFSEDLRRTAGNTLFTIAGALVVFVLVDSVVDTNKHVGVIGSIIYLVVAISLFIFGGLLLNSIRKTERDKIRYITGDTSRHIAVRLEGERPRKEPHPPVTDTTKPPARKQKNKRTR